MLGLPTTPTEMTHAVLATWRVVVPTGAAQIIGAMVGHALGLHAFWLLSAWLGAATETPVGSLIGLAWHGADRARATSNRPFVLFMGLLSLLLPVVGWLIVPNLPAPG